MSRGIPTRHFVYDPAGREFVLYDVCARPEARYSYSVPDEKIAKRIVEALNDAEDPVRRSGAGDFTPIKRRK